MKQNTKRMMMMAAISMSVFGWCTALADTWTDDYGRVWTYTVKDGAATVGGNSYTSPAVNRSTVGDIVIPDTLGGCPVTTIAGSAFQECANIRSIVIPDSVTSIKRSAFAYCTSLRLLKFGNGISSINYGTSSQSQFVGGDNGGIKQIVTYDNPFKGCSALAGIEFGTNAMSYLKMSNFSDSKRLSYIYFSGQFPTTVNGTMPGIESRGIYVTHDAYPNGLPQTMLAGVPLKFLEGELPSEGKSWDLIFVSLTANGVLQRPSFFLSSETNSTTSCERFFEGDPIYCCYSCMDFWGVADIANSFTNVLHLSGTDEVAYSVNDNESTNGSAHYYYWDSQLFGNLQNLPLGEYKATLVLNETRAIQETSYANNTNTITFSVVPSTTITFVSEGNMVTERRYETGAAYGDFPVNPIRQGFRFVGWFTDEDGEDAVTASSIVPSLPTTLYAHWKVAVSETVTVGGTLATGTTTWLYGNLYKVTSNLVIPSGATLIIDPGVIVKFAAGKSLAVNSGGSLSAVGTRTLPIVFTSIKDDENGGDTNGDGVKTAPNGGDWYGVTVYGNANFAYATMMYAGPNNECGIIATRENGVLKMDSCKVAHAKYDGIWNWGGSVSVKNTIVMDTGWATAPFRGSKNEYVNCVFYENNVGMCYWSHWSGKPVYKNCIFDKCLQGWCETASGSYTSPPATISVANCLFYNPQGEGVQSCNRVGKAGNIWGNPLFVNPEKGDFRIAANSPCVDAGDGTVAPEKDYYGLSRRDVDKVTDSGVPSANGNCPDIGIHEVLWDGDESPYDIAPTSVSVDKTKAKVGDNVKVSWTIQNLGTEDVVGGWHDAVSLISTSGQSVELGEILTTYTLKRKMSMNVNGTFTIPALPEGTWYARVNTNNRRSDVPEGLNTTNNVLTSTQGIAISVAATPYADGASGTLSVGSSTVVKFTFPAGTTGQIARVSVPAGLSVSYGLGFVPQGAYASGTMTATEKGEVMFHVPAGTAEVYLVMDAAQSEGQDYSVSFEDGDLAITSVSPNTVNTTESCQIVIDGAGFDGSESVILSQDGTEVQARSIYLISPNRLAALFDGAQFSGQGKYRLIVVTGDTEAYFDDAVTVVAEGKASFWCRLNAPDTVRHGRRYRCSIEYGNSGAVTMQSPVFTVTLSEAGGTLTTEASPLGHNELFFYGAGDNDSAGELLPGSSHRIDFVYIAGADDEIRLYTSYGKDFFPTNWPDAHAYHLCLSQAACRIGRRNEDPTDYSSVLELASKIRIGDKETTCWGVLSDATGTPLSGTVVSISNKIGDVMHSVVVGKDGRFKFSQIREGEWFASLGDGLFETTLNVRENTDHRLVFPVNELIPDVVIHHNGLKDGYDTIESKTRFCTQSPLWSASGTRFYSLVDDDYRIVHTYSNGTSKVIAEFCEADIPMMLRITEEIGDRYIAVDEPDAVCVFAVCKDTGEFLYAERSNDNNLWEFAGVAGRSYQIFAIGSNGEVKAIAEKRIQLRLLDAVGISRNISRKGLLASSSGEVFYDGRFHDGFNKIDVDDVLDGMARVMKKTKPPTNGDWQKPQDPDFYLPSQTCHAGHKPCYCIRDSVSKTEAELKELEKQLKDIRRFYNLYEDLARSASKAWWWTTVSDISLSLANIISDVYGIPYSSELAEFSKHYFANDLGPEVFADEFFDWAVSKGFDSLPYRDTMRLGDIYSELRKFKSSSRWDVLNKEADYVERMYKYYKEYDDAYYKYLSRCTKMNEQNFSCTCRTDEVPFPSPLDESCKPKKKQSEDPNEIVGPDGTGEARYVQPGEWMNYTIYFENKANATAAAQEVYVTNPLSEWLDWSTFEMGEVSFNNQIDIGLSGLCGGMSEVQMSGTNYAVRTFLSGGNGGDGVVATSGVAHWYMRIVDNSDETTWPADPYAGFLPPNDPDTHCGEGHISYRIKVRDDAPRNVIITNSATIVFDYNAPIETDPAWWNTVGTFHDVELEVDGVMTNLTLIAGEPFGELPTPKTARTGYTFDGWYTGENGTGAKATPDALVPTGDFMLYANWIANNYVVAYKANGGEGEMPLQTNTYDSVFCLVSNAFTRTSHRFSGWAVNETGEVVYEDGAVVSNLTAVAGGIADLYAMWELITMEVSFDLNYADAVEPAPQSIVVTNGMEYGTLPEADRTGYAFDGWANSHSARYARVAAETVVTNETDHTLYAQWLPNAYSVRFNACGGTGVMPDQSLAYDHATRLAQNAFSYPRHAFCGWATNEAGEVVYENEAEVLNLTTEPNAVVDLYAVWAEGVIFAEFIRSEVVQEEGGLISVRVSGGNDNRTSSVDVYLTFNTAVAADVDMANGAVDGVTPKGGLKFPLTLSWAKGEVGEKVITIPVKSDKAVEGDEFFTLQLANAVGVEIGEVDICTVTIKDANTYATLQDGVMNPNIKVSTSGAGKWDVGMGSASSADGLLGLFHVESPALLQGQNSTLSLGGTKGNGKLSLMMRFLGDPNEKIPSSVAMYNGNHYIATIDHTEITNVWEEITITTTGARASAPNTYNFVFTQGSDPNTHVEISEIWWNGNGSVSAYDVWAWSDGTGGGHVTGSGPYMKGQTAKLVAKPLPGWAFDGWYEWKRDDQGELYNEFWSNSATVSYKVTQGLYVMAFFSKIPYIRALADPADGGKVSGSGLCEKGKKVTLKATANKNFTFLGWRQGSEELLEDDFVATTDTLVIDRSAKPAASSKTSTTITNLTGDVTYYAVFKSDPKVTVFVEATGAGAEPTGKGTGKYVAGTITGEGKFATGKTKIALKSAANKGYVFAGWYDETDALLTKDATYTIAAMGESDVELVAKFITTDEDKASIALAVDGLELEPWVSKTETHAFATNIWTGVYLEWPVAASALSEAKVKVAGLPAGLKFTDKPVTTKIGTGKNAITVTNVLANTIYGAPTAASKIDAKTKSAKPSEVKLTVTTAGKSTQTYQIDTIVDALPMWAQGTFAGGWEPEDAATSGGQVSLTVDAKGKVSGKALGEGLTYTLAAPYYSAFALDENQASNFLADVTASWSYKDGTKTIKTNEVVQLVVQDNIIGGYAAVDDWFEAYTVNWKVEPWKTLGKSFDKKTLTYAILADGTFSEDEDVLTSALGEEVVGRVTLKFAATGAVAIVGEFVSGYDVKKSKYTTVKATSSATLVPVDDERGAVFIYLTPKGLAPHARCMEVQWPEE